MKTKLLLLLLSIASLAEAQHCSPSSGELRNIRFGSEPNSAQFGILRMRVDFDYVIEGGPEIDSYQVYLVSYAVADEDKVFELKPDEYGSGHMVSANLLDDEVMHILQKTVIKYSPTASGDPQNISRGYPYRWQVPVGSLLSSITETDSIGYGTYRLAVYIPHTQDSIRSQDVPAVHDCNGMLYMIFEPLPYEIQLEGDSAGLRQISTLYKPKITNKHRKRVKRERKRIEKLVGDK